MTDLSTITATATDDGWRLTAGDVTGRVRGSRVELGPYALEVTRTGTRSELRTPTGNPVLRFDPAGRKATTLTTAGGRHRLARLRSRPLQHRWQLTHDVRSEPVLRVTHTPVGYRLVVLDAGAVAPDELGALVLGALASVLDVPAAAVAA